MVGTKFIVHGQVVSPPVRSVLLTLEALNLDYNNDTINNISGDIDPLGSFTLKDGNSNFSESHAICAYLVRKYAADDTLYSKDFEKRAHVDQRLHFECGVLYHTCFRKIMHMIINENAKEIPEQIMSQIHDAYANLEHFLNDHPYMAGDNLTIADFSIISTVSSLHMTITPIDANQFPKLSGWLTRMESLPYYKDANLVGLQVFADFIKSKLPKQFNKLWQKAVADIKSGKLAG